MKNAILKSVLSSAIANIKTIHPVGWLAIIIISVLFLSNGGKEDYILIKMIFIFAVVMSIGRWRMTNKKSFN